MAETVSEVLSDAHAVRLMLDFEVALARVQKAMGILPAAAADEIIRCGRPEMVPADALAEQRRVTAHPLLAFLAVWARSMTGDASEWVHYGATTMDVMNTVYVLQLRAAAWLFVERLRAIEAVLLELAVAHRATPMIGRTLGRHALPITFGFKVSVWLAENRRNIGRLVSWRESNDVGVLSGAVGSYAAFGARGFEIEAAVMAELGLRAVEDVDWKGSRDGYAEFACIAAIVGKTLGRIGQEIFLLQGDDIGELTEIGSGVGSSTMPHKSNPARCIAVMSGASEVAGYVTPMLDWMMTMFERDSTQQVGPMTAQCLALDRQMRTMQALLSGLGVNGETMLRNLRRTNGLILAEDLMFRLGHAMGKQRAHDIVADLAADAYRRGVSLRAAVEGVPEMAAVLGEDGLASLSLPERYVGLAVEVVDRTVVRVRRAREEEGRK